MSDRPVTVVETHAFLTAAKGVLSGEERAAIIDLIAMNPLLGVSLGGGVRKVRVALGGGGKSGGARVVHFFGGVDIPIFLLTVFAKNERANLSKSEQTALIADAKTIAEDYRRRR